MIMVVRLIQRIFTVSKWLLTKGANYLKFEDTDLTGRTGNSDSGQFRVHTHVVRKSDCKYTKSFKHV